MKYDITLIAVAIVCSIALLAAILGFGVEIPLVNKHVEEIHEAIAMIPD